MGFGLGSPPTFPLIRKTREALEQTEERVRRATMLTDQTGSVKSDCPVVACLAVVTAADGFDRVSPRGRPDGCPRPPSLLPPLVRKLGPGEGLEGKERTLGAAPVQQSSWPAVGTLCFSRNSQFLLQTIQYETIFEKHAGVP